jgi:hypothetical protein
LNNLADIKSAGGVALRVRTQGGAHRRATTPHRGRSHWARRRAARPKGKKEQEIGPRSQARRQSLSTKNPFCTSIDFRRAHRQSAHKGLLVCQIVNGRGKVRTGGKVWLAEGPNLPKGA